MEECACRVYVVQRLTTRWWWFPVNIQLGLDNTMERPDRGDHDTVYVLLGEFALGTRIFVPTNDVRRGYSQLAIEFKLNETKCTELRSVCKPTLLTKSNI